ATCGSRCAWTNRVAARPPSAWRARGSAGERARRPGPRLVRAVPERPVRRADRVAVGGAAHREREALGPYEPPQRLDHLIELDRHQLLELLLGRDLNAQLQFLAGDVVHAARDALLAHHHRALDLHLRRLDLVRARTVLEQPVELFAQQPQRLARLVGRHAEVDADRAAVA